MVEEIKAQDEQKNTVATVGMWFSIIGLIIFVGLYVPIAIFIFIAILFIIFGKENINLVLESLSLSVPFFARLGLSLLVIGLILGIIGLFHKPRGKARVAVVIPLVVFIALASIACYVGKSVKTPANEFIGWAEPQLEQLESENFDGDAFGDLLEAELNNVTSNTTDEERKDLFEASTGSNFLEKGSYLFFSVLMQSFENALQKYNEGELPEIVDEDNNIIDVDIDVEDDENDEGTNEESNSEKEPVEQEEVTVTQPKKTNSETFSQSEKNDIEQILNILE